MILQAFAVGRLEANCYVVGDEESREVMVIDPGDDAPKLLEYFRARDLRVTTVFATHHHPDHTGGIHELLEALPEATFAMHRLDYPGVAQSASFAAAILGHELTPPREPDRYVEHGDTIEVGRHSFTALLCPGHTPGSQCFLIENNLVSGDTLFIRGCGRTDLPGGNAEELYNSLTQKIKKLPEDTILLPGHNYTDDSTSTLKEEKKKKEKRGEERGGGKRGSEPTRRARGGSRGARSCAPPGPTPR